MKQVLLVLVLLFLFFPLPVAAEEGIDRQLLDEQSRAAGVSDLSRYYDTYLYQDTQEIAPDFSIDTMLDDLYDGKNALMPDGLLAKIAKLLFRELYQNLSGMVIIILIAILCGFLTNMGTLGEEGGTQQAAFFVCYALICTVCAKMFITAVEGSVGAITNMSEFVKALTPVLVTLIATTGQVTGAAIMNPVLYSAASVIITVVGNILVPLVYCIFVLCAVNCVSSGFSMSKLVKLLKSVIKWIMGITLTVFTGITVIYSISSGAVDSIASRTAKFAVGNFIPLVGGMLSDSIDLIISCSAIIKKGVGIAGIVVIVLLFASVAFRLVAQLWLFRLAAAFIQPVSDKRLAQLLDDTADCISMVFSALCMCAVLFLIVIVVIICVGNVGAL